MPLLIKENENILLFDPEYGHFVDVIKNLKRNVVFFKLNIDNKYIINFKKLEKYQIDNCYNIINNLGLIATKICYESGQDWKNKLLKTIKENRYHSLKYINMKMPELKVYPS